MKKCSGKKVYHILPPKLQIMLLSICSRLLSVCSRLLSLFYSIRGSFWGPRVTFWGPRVTFEGPIAMLSVALGLLSVALGLLSVALGLLSVTMVSISHTIFLNSQKQRSEHCPNNLLFEVRGLQKNIIRSMPRIYLFRSAVKAFPRTSNSKVLDRQGIYNQHRLPLQVGHLVQN